MRHAESKASKVFENVALFGIGVPVVGLLMGGIYSMPAMRVCKGREPWLSVSLSIGLAITVFGLGYLADTPILFSIGAWSFSVILLLVARGLHGTLDGNLERFGLVHATALLIVFALAALAAHMGYQETPNPPVNVDARDVPAHACDRAACAGYRER